MQKPGWTRLGFPVDPWVRNVVVSFFDRGSREREIVKRIIDRRRNRPMSLDVLSKATGAVVHRSTISKVNQPFREFGMPVRIKSKEGKFFLAHESD